MVIRQPQIDAFQEPLARDFAARMRARLRSRYQSPLARTNEEDLAQLVRDGIRKANGYGLEREPDIARFLDFTVEYGPEFDGTPWAQPVLSDTSLSGSRKMDILDDLATFNIR